MILHLTPERAHSAHAMPRVWNIRNEDWPAGTVYIGRGTRGWPRSKWANLFVIGHGGSREECIKLYEEWLRDNPKGQHLLKHIGELRGKDLLCWCAPLPCHGDVLLRLANA